MKSTFYIKQKDGTYLPQIGPVGLDKNEIGNYFQNSTGQWYVFKKAENGWVSVRDEPVPKQALMLSLVIN